MCGIAGIVSCAPPDRARLAAAARLLAHRGPDDEGIETIGAAAPFAGLAFRRLSIIDLSPAGHQPMVDASGARWIVFNGEIYNFKTLRAELEKKGARFRSQSDTEVVMAAYAAWGEGCIGRLDGMFAFAIWDDEKKRLFAVRDRFGKKPFWYAENPDGGIGFASEMRALLALAPRAREISPEALALYLVYQYVPPPHSILKGVHKLPPAHQLIWEKGRLTVERYWRPEPVPVIRDAREAGGRVRELLERAVEARLLASDVPVGAFLSGGIDSTLVVGLASRIAGRRLSTFSIGFDEKTHDETRFARIAAQAFGTDHHEFRVRPDALSLLPELVDHYGEPFADSSAIPTYYLARETARHVKVVLTGDGGDELFMGYPRYKAAEEAARADRMWEPLKRILGAPPLMRLLSRAPEGSLPHRGFRFLSHLARPPRSRYLGWVGVFHPEALPGLLSGDLLPQSGNPGNFLEETYDACPLPADDFLAQTAYVDLVTYLPHDLLVKVDVATMAHGLEARCPFLDPALAALAIALPADLRLPGTGGKRVLKEAFRDLLPGEIRARSKMGFGVPLAAWFRGDLKPLLLETLSPRRVAERGWFRPDAVRRLVDAHLSGRAAHGYRLWALLFLEAWAERFLSSPAAEP